MKKGQFLTFKLKGRRDSISGILLNYSDEWIMIRRCYDYRLDGYTIFDKTKILITTYDAYEKRAELILRKKQYKWKEDFSLKLKSIEDFLTAITLNFTLVQLDNKKGDANDVVKYVDKNGDLFLFKELLVSGEWRFDLLLPRKEVGFISFDTDYLNSLKLIVK